jgi:hypothetical protein
MVIIVSMEATSHHEEASSGARGFDIPPSLRDSVARAQWAPIAGAALDLSRVGAE